MVRISVPAIEHDVLVGQVGLVEQRLHGLAIDAHIDVDRGHRVARQDIGRLGRVVLKGPVTVTAAVGHKGVGAVEAVARIPPDGPEHVFEVTVQHLQVVAHHPADHQLWARRVAARVGVIQVRVTHAARMAGRGGEIGDVPGLDDLDLTHDQDVAAILLVKDRVHLVGPNATGLEHIVQYVGVEVLLEIGQHAVLPPRQLGHMREEALRLVLLPVAGQHAIDPAGMGDEHGVRLAYGVLQRLLERDHAVGRVLDQLPAQVRLQQVQETNAFQAPPDLGRLFADVRRAADAEQDGHYHVVDAGAGTRV